jgi:hypothetical protein
LKYQISTVNGTGLILCRLIFAESAARPVYVSLNAAKFRKVLAQDQYFAR